MKLLLFDHLHYSEFSRSHTAAHSSAYKSSEAAVVKVNSSMDELDVAGTTVMILFL